MPATRAEIVAEARDWVGTRYQHQGHLKGRAADCGGLVYGVGSALNLLPADPVQLPDARTFEGYPHRPAPGSVAQACTLLLDPIAVSEASSGDIYLMRFDGEAQHVAIITVYGIVHAVAMLRRVVEHRLDLGWKNKIVAAYRYRGVI